MTVLIIGTFSSYQFAAADDDKNKNKGPKTLQDYCKTIDDKSGFPYLVCMAIADLQNQINHIQLTPGPQGPQGVPGPQGQPGPAGTINAQTCPSGDYVSGINAAGALICTPLPTNAGGSTGNTNQGIYVSTLLGNDQYPGTIQYPMKTINAGIQKAASSGLVNVYVDKGTYTEQVTLANGVSIFGGYDATNSWTRSSSSVTTITNGIVSSTSSTPPSLQIMGIAGSNINSATVVDGFTISTASGNSASIQQGISSYGVYCNTCPGLTLSHDMISSGDGGTGYAGVNGPPGPPGGSGVPGTSGGNGGDSIGVYLIGSTGATLSSDTITSGSGGMGGVGGVGGPAGPIGPGGIPGTQGQGGNGGNGGSSYSVYGSSTSISTSGDALSNGPAGTSGAGGFGSPDGVSGLSGQAANTKFV